jgi:hypothetical protein
MRGRRTRRILVSLGRHDAPRSFAARNPVLGTLAEKQGTVPDSYPLTLNALVSGCNQKTNRDPVMEASESEVQAAVDALKAGNLVIEQSGGIIKAPASGNPGDTAGCSRKPVSISKAISSGSSARPSN